MSTLQTAHAPLVPDAGVRAAMMADHAGIATLFDDVVAAFRSGDRDEAAAMFAQFEQRLEAHLALEDQLLLPPLRAAHPDEVAALAEDHRKIRARLAELGVGVDLHFTRASWVAAFVDSLRAHAQREDALLYRWAAEPTAKIDTRAVLRRLAAL